MHRAAVLPLAVYELPVLQGWADEFRDAMAPRLLPPMQALVQGHLQAGDLCAIVTATDRLVAAPFAQLFGVPHLVATEPEIVDGRLTGDIAGEPCFREHKVTRVARWLAGLGAGTPTLQGFGQSWFYSDSISDLPLLEAVTHPVAVRPDARLRALAEQRGWATR
jgi:HAD superfamily hydrolase (TIGR01490 family)